MTPLALLIVLIVFAFSIYFAWSDGFRDGYYKGWIARGEVTPKWNVKRKIVAKK